MAISLDPDTLLLDEVFSVGDQEFREKSRKIMLDRFSQDKTIVFVTHNVNMVKRICDRVVWLDHGTVIAYGGVDEVPNKSGPELTCRRTHTSSAHGRSRESSQMVAWL